MLLFSTFFIYKNAAIFIFFKR